MEGDRPRIRADKAVREGRYKPWLLFLQIRVHPRLSIRNPQSAIRNPQSAILIGLHQAVRDGRYKPWLLFLQIRVHPRLLIRNPQSQIRNSYWASSHSKRGKIQALTTFFRSALIRGFQFAIRNPKSAILIGLHPTARRSRRRDPALAAALSHQPDQSILRAP